MSNSRIVAIIPSGGVGSRARLSIPKQYYEISGKPLILYAMQNLSASSEIGSFVVPIDFNWRNYIEEKISEFRIEKPVHFVKSGDERQNSVENALFSDYVENMDYVLIHDAVRIFTNTKLINTLIDLAKTYRAAIPKLPIKDTIKSSINQVFVSQTVPRNNLYAIQTPQVFEKQLICSAFENARTSNFIGTDDSSLVELMDYPIKLVDGDEFNFKITTEFDLLIAKYIIDNKLFDSKS